MKVAMVGRVNEEQVREISKLGFEMEHITPADVDSGNYKTDAVVICGSMLLAKMDLSKFKNLKYIFLYSMGIDYLPEEYIRENNIIVTNNHGAYSEPIGEWTVFNLLEMAKMAKVDIRNQDKKLWKYRLKSGNLYGKKILFLGTGSLAQEGAKRLQGFDMEIVGYNTSGRNVKYFDYCVKDDNLDSELSSADFIVMVLPATESTNGFLNEDRFKKLKDGVSIVNISRGAVIDERALVENLRSGKVRAAALDVFKVEPLPVESPLWDMDNVYISPHISSSSEDAEERFLRGVVANLKNLKEGRDVVNIVNFDRGY